jgi:alkylation response protein AidB-like acyl-CoA dehydrogenase
MDFSFTDEQQMLLDTTRRFVASRYSFDARRAIAETAEGWSRDVWTQMADLGLLAINIREEDGGLDAGPVGTMLVAGALGEALSLEPFLTSAVVATHLIGNLASATQRAEWLPALGSGDLQAVLVHDEGDALHVAFEAREERGGWWLEGSLQGVYHAGLAGLLLVVARIGDGTGVFAVMPETPGVRVSSRGSVDGQRMADVVLDGVHVDVSARVGGEALGPVRDALDAGLAALCADALGAMERILAATIAYTRSRVQFGTPIGGFQALQHRMAEMLIHMEQARSMSYLATAQCTNPDLPERREALSAAKALMGQAARYIGQQAVQLHGGMGMTDELDVSHAFKRLLAFELRYGTTDERLASYREHVVVA